MTWRPSSGARSWRCCGARSETSRKPPAPWELIVANSTGCWRSTRSLRRNLRMPLTSDQHGPILQHSSAGPFPPALDWSSTVFARYQDLQRYVDWSPADQQRIIAAGRLVIPRTAALIDDFYAEIE